MDDEITELLTQAMAFLEEIAECAVDDHERERAFCTHALVQRAWGLHAGYENVAPLDAEAQAFIAEWHARDVIDSARRGGGEDA